MQLTAYCKDSFFTTPQRNFLNTKTWLIMKLTAILLFVGLLQASAKGIAQKITLSEKNVSLEIVFKEIRKQTGYNFFYKVEWLQQTSKVTIDVKNASLVEVLDLCFKDQFLSYTIVDKTIMVKQKETEKTKETFNTTIINAPLPPLKIRGKVADENGNALNGASIQIKGTSLGTTTKANGEFQIDVPDNSSKILVFSFVGMEQQEVNISEKTELNIFLRNAVAQQQEVVVIGYGTQKKSDLTGSVISLKEADFNKGTNTSVAQLIQGRAPGVQITQSSGEPGGGVSIRIRGSSSINAGNEPLYVIDGLAIDNSAPITEVGIGFSGSPPPRNPLNALNPSDIESIEILKDASATAIYGSRGANGVILVTTKHGKDGKLNVDYNSSVGISTVLHKMELLKTSEYISIMNELAQARGLPNPFSVAQISEIGKGTDWQDVIFRSAVTQNHNISLSGGSNKTNFFISLNYNDQNGVVINSGFKRFQGRINLEHQASEKFKFGVNLNTSLINDSYISTNGSAFNQQADVINTTLNVPPVFSIFDANGNYTRPENGVAVSVSLDNPLALANGIRALGKTNRTFGNVYGEYNIIPGLSAKLTFGSDRTNSRRDIYQSTITNLGNTAGGYATIQTGELSNNLFEGILSYKKSFKKLHNINAVVGSTFQQFDTRQFNGSIQGFPSDLIATNNLALGNTNFDNLSSITTKRRLISYLGRINYSFNNKYLITASFRADGSSNFGPNNKYGFFPSFSTAWKLGEEDFIKSMNVFSNLKLRLGWGQIGNDDIGIGRALATYNRATGGTTDAIFGNTIYAALSPSRIPNPDLKWEKTEQVNIGLDMGILKNRISVTLDFYIKNTNDLLLDLPIPSSTGFSVITENIGKIRNIGTEILVTSKNIDKKFKWNSSFNLATLTNKVISLGSIPSIISTLYGGSAIAKPGESLFAYYGYQALGIFQTKDEIANSAQKNTAIPGVPKWRDVNNDQKIDDKDRVILGKTFPDFTYGLSNSFSFKNINLDVFFDGAQGFSLFNGEIQESLYPRDPYRNRLAEPLLNRWTPQNPTNKWPSGVDITKYSGADVNSFSVSDASYLRLKNVHLSYQFQIAKIKLVRSASVYVAGQNLFTITKYSGYDPDINSTSSSTVRIDRNSYPSFRTFSIGINLGF